MFGLVIQWLISALALLAISRFVPGYYMEGVLPAVIAAIVIGLLNALLGLVAKVVTSPFTIAAFGVCLFGINALTILLASKIAPGFDVEGFSPALWGALVMTLLGLGIRGWVREE
jgi:putative membrane protein